MRERIKDCDLDYVFSRLENQASNRGVDTEGWQFGQPYGSIYYITSKGKDGRYIVAGGWSTKREAWEGIMAMSAGLCLIPFGE